MKLGLFKGVIYTFDYLGLRMHYRIIKIFVIEKSHQDGHFKGSRVIYISNSFEIRVI